MKHESAVTGSTVRAKWLLRGSVLVVLGLLTGVVMAGSKDDVSKRISEWNAVKQRMDEISRKVNDYMEKSKKLREMDKTELDSLITQLCGLDIARDDDEADRLARSLRDRIVKNVTENYDSLDREAGGIDDDAESAINDARGQYKEVREFARGLQSEDEGQGDVKALLDNMSTEIDRFVISVYERLSRDWKTLTNLKEGTMNGSNNPRIRAAMEYGKQRHIYNQQICEEKELILSSGRPDCVSFQKDSCLVWEFKPDTYSESEAKSQAEKYLRDVQDKFKDDQRALENCKKDSDGKPIFEARGVTYPKCNL